MGGSSTLNNKSDYKAFKFSENSQEMKALKRNSERNSEVQRQSSDGIVEMEPQVNQFLAWKDWDPLQAVPRATSLSIKEGGKERKKNHTKKTLEDSDRPELVAFFQEHNYQFVKAIFMDGEVPPLNKCLVESCEMDHNLLNSEQSKLRIEKDSNKDAINKYESKNLKTEDEETTDARDVGFHDCSAEKIGPERQLIEKAASTEEDLANSMVQSVIQVNIDNNSHTTKASSDSPITTKSCEEEFQQHASSQHFLEAHHRPQAVPEHTLHSGSISCQSNSSNASSNSFVFPILPSEWNGSPVRMAKADRRQLRKQRSWKMCFLCRKF